jgi:hypothetical protein
VAPEPGQPVVDFDGERDLVRGALIADLVQFGLDRADQPRDRGDAEKPRRTPGLWRPTPVAFVVYLQKQRLQSAFPHFTLLFLNRSVDRVSVRVSGTHQEFEH